MSADSKINILLVDDLAAKLLSLETILAPLGENVVKTSSADEALHYLLSNDVAVVLVDVCMPGMNGFELAEMIREHPRYQRTAIIFISAVHLTDADRMKGYELGAVDYIPVPIIPEVLRAKVAVFAELYRKSRELQRLNRELEQRVRERTSDLEASSSRLRESEERFQQIAHTIDDAFWLVELQPDPRVLYISPGWEKVWGRPAGAEHSPLKCWGDTVLEEDRKHMAEAIDRALAPESDGVWSREYRIVRPSGEQRWIRERGRILRSETTGSIRCVGLAEDFDERKQAEAVLARDREALEQLVHERTVELETSNLRLRMADRMATIGTLSAGLGHDMGNLLLPVRMRLDTIEAQPLSDDVRREVGAIRKASEYLQRLARNLRLLSLDPEGEGEGGGETNLAEWWSDVEGMIRNALHRSVKFSGKIEPGLPRVQIGRAGLTQVVFNLVQNAGDALHGRPGGHVRISAEPDPHTGGARLCVSDNGPGMSEEVRRRCMEPFFTTKTRGMSTGLGLALVSGIVKNAKATMEIDAAPEGGTIFRINLPAAKPGAADAGAPQKRGVASVRLNDRRMVAHVQAVLTSLEFDVLHDVEADVDLLVTEAESDGTCPVALGFLAARPESRALVFGGRINGEGGGRVVCLDFATKPSALRSQIRSVLKD